MVIVVNVKYTIFICTNLLYIKKNVEKIPVDDELPEIELTEEWEKEIKEIVVKSHDSLK